MGQKKQVVFVKPDEASSFELKGIRIDQLLPKEACSQFSAYRVKMKPHQVKKTSYHKVGEELYYVLSGKGLAVLDGEKYVLSQGCFFSRASQNPASVYYRGRFPRSFKLS